jgi:hypothetical protein
MFASEIDIVFAVFFQPQTYAGMAQLVAQLIRNQ